MMRYTLTVIALLALAALACSIKVSTAHFGELRLYDTLDADANPTRAFAPGETVYARVDMKDVDGALPVVAVWSRVASEGDTLAVEELDRAAIDAANGPLIFEFAPPAEGDYRLDLYLDGDKKETIDFRVR